MLEFTARFTKADHTDSVEHQIVAHDIDGAASVAIHKCPDDSFVSAVAQSDIPDALQFVLTPGQRISELDEADLGELAELVCEELGRRRGGVEVSLVYTPKT